MPALKKCLPPPRFHPPPPPPVSQKRHGWLSHWGCRLSHWGCPLSHWGCRLSHTKAAGASPQYVMASSTSGIVSVVYRGVEEKNYTDGIISFVKAGVTPSTHEVAGFGVEKVDPVVFQDFSIACARPIHHVTHDQKIAFFCDGSFEGRVNSTVWVVDERYVGQGDRALVFQRTLEGSHHGVCVPVDDGHFLISAAEPARAAGYGGSALPVGFHVYDDAGNIIHGLNEVEDPGRSCTGFHGSGVSDNTFTFACDADHGGLLVVDYGQVVTYASRKLSYPSAYEAHRTGTLEEGAHGVIVGNFADRANQSYKLVAFDPKRQSSEIQMEHILDLPASQCSFKFEKAGGELLVLWMPTGDLKIYTVDPEWTLIADISVFKDMEACTGTLMVLGYGHAYILRGNRMLDFDLSDLSLIPAPTAVDLEFVPASGTTAGVPKGFECTAPRIPTETTANTSTLFAQISLGRPDLAPESRAMSLLLFNLRRNITNSLEVGLNRVYVEEYHRENKTHLFVKLLIGEPGPNDSNQEHAEELIEHLVTEPKRSNLAGTFVRKDPRLVAEGVPTPAARCDDGWPAGAIATVIFLVALAVGFAAIAVLFRKRAQSALRQLQQVKQAADLSQV